VYRFGAYRLDPAARELRHDGELLPLPRRVFDGLAYLLDKRERAVGHDELISALWGRVDVANAQLSQLIMQVRRAVGDDSQAQHSVRTIAGFGYRWVVSTEVIASDDARLPASAAVTEAGEASAAATNAVAASPRARMRPRRRVGVALLALLALAVLAILAWRTFAPEPLSKRSGAAVVVLPFEVDAPEDIDAGWARLGAMDLVAARLRRAGLPVPPSDAVIAAAHASAALPEAERMATLRRTLGAGLLVHGVATHTRDGWTIELRVDAESGARPRVESGRHELVDAARRASDQLLAALGHGIGDEAQADVPLEERLQRTRAAVLANQLDTARALVADAPESMRKEPELRYELARVEFHAGQFERAAAIADKVLADPAIATMPRLRARALRMQGWIALNQDRGWAVVEPAFDASVRALDGLRAPGDLGLALAERGVARVMLGRLDEAARDLGQARAQLEIAGDRRTLGEMNNYFGHLELARQRVGQALPYFRSAADIAESFGSVNTMRYNLSASMQAQMRLLRWPEALATGEQLRALRERIENRGLRAAGDAYYALALVGNGHLDEAERVLAPYQADSQPGFDPEYLRFALLARAELAARRGRLAESLAAATRALELWPAEAITESGERARCALLRQRASSALGQPVEARIGALAASDPAADTAVVDRIARAEWAAAGDRTAEAEALFDEATATAEAQGVPDMIVAATGAYLRWLLAQGRTADAVAQSGRIGVWAAQDFDSAALQVAAFHASGETDAWARALEQARQLAGDRTIPAALSNPPTPAVAH
jgi:DNA-binding winged helix-turn-helix (wHTH) protein/tetratricopeptide (TPR) repeat protein